MERKNIETETRFAVVKLGGTDFIVEEGDHIYPNKLNYGDNETFFLQGKFGGDEHGNIFLNKISIELKVIKNQRIKGSKNKVISFKKKPKKNYKRKFSSRRSE